MKARFLRGLKSVSLLFVWLLLLQFISSVITVLVVLIFGFIHPVGPTPLWQWIMIGVLTCLSWFFVGWCTPDAVQLGPVGAVAELTVWTVLTSLMGNLYLINMPQLSCGGMVIQILRRLRDDYAAWLDVNWDIPIGCVLLSVAFGVGLLLSRKHPKATQVPGRENA